MNLLKLLSILFLSLSLLSLSCGDAFLNVEELLQTSHQKNHRRIEELKLIPVTKEIITKPDGEIKIIRQGLAQEYRLFESDGRTVYRHYTTRDVAKLIKDTGIIKAGPRPSAITLNSSIELNTDIYGIFFTQAIDSPRAPAELVPVDFIIPSGYKVIQTYQDEFVIPGPRPIQEWLLQEINRNPDRYPELVKDLKLNEAGKYVLKEEPLIMPVKVVN